MGNISGKLNLRQLISVMTTMQGRNGETTGIFIPIDANHLYRGEKGAIYLDISAFEIKERKPDKKDTHIVKQSLPKEIRDAMTDEQKKAMPTLGNIIVWGHHDQSPQEFNDAGPLSLSPEEDDLPF